MYIGVDWGGTKIEVIAMDEAGAELLRVREVTPQHDYRACLTLIRDLVERVEAQTGQRGLVGIGIPGSLAPKTGIAKGASSTWILGKRLEANVVEALGREVRMDNDANCFAVSEARDGAGAGHRVVYAVILGTGVGAGIAINGTAHAGPNTSGGEWGHSPLPWPTVNEIPGRACYCGRHGCLETFCSGTGFAKDYNAHADEPLKPAEIIARMRAGERRARLVYERWIDRVARGLALVVNALDPDIFVMGGGMSNVEELYEDLPPRLASHIFSDVFDTPIVKAKHGDSSGVRGAAWLWKDEIDAGRRSARA